MKMRKLFTIATLSLGFLLPQSVLADAKFDGFYAGVQAGYVDGKDKGTEYSDEDGGGADGWTQKTTPDSGLIGGFVGFNKVLENNMLVGIEADYEYRGGSGKSHQKEDGVTDLNYPVKTKLKEAGSLRARLGYLFNEGKTLGYLTAGYATANIKRTFSDLGEAASESESKWHDGWTVGFGAEHLVSEKISVKAEYRYSDYGRETISTALYGDGIEQKQKYQDEQSIRIGAAYHF